MLKLPKSSNHVFITARYKHDSPNELATIRNHHHIIFNYFFVLSTNKTTLSTLCARDHAFVTKSTKLLIARNHTSLIIFLLYYDIRSSHGETVCIVAAITTHNIIILLTHRSSVYVIVAIWITGVKLYVFFIQFRAAESNGCGKNPIAAIDRYLIFVLPNDRRFAILRKCNETRSKALFFRLNIRFLIESVTTR